MDSKTVTSTKFAMVMEATDAMRVGDFVKLLRSDIKSDQRYRDVAITGELGRVTISGPGHWYLDLKDSDGQLSCVAWRGTASRVSFEPKAGDEVIIVGSLDIYPARGSIQLVISEMRKVSALGALEEARRVLVERLREDGSLERPRQPLPTIPNHLCLITGAGSAALADMQRLIDERWPGLRRTVISVLVQGERAAGEIVRAIESANRMSDPFWAKANGVQPIDLIICGRGGGSPEDLWAFNLEPVASAFIDSETPIVSAVGHESDILVTDMVADLRAATPSHAIERCVPYRSDLVQRCDDFRLAMSSAMYRRFERLRDSITHLRARLGQAPISGLMRTRTRIDNLGNRLSTAANNHCQQERSRLSTAAATLNAIHPDKVSKRGWALIRDSAGCLITSAATTNPGSSISIRFHDGALSAEVKQKELDEHE